MVKFRARALEWLQSKTYMKSEIDTALNGKSDSNHAHSQYLTSHRTVDSSFNNSSTNAVQNRVVAGAFEELEDNLQYEILCFTNQGLTTPAYNFDIDSNVYIVVNAYDVYGNRVNFSGNEEELTVITNNGTDTVVPAQAITYQGRTSCLYVYTADSWGQCRFSIKTFVSYINVGNPYPVGSIYMSVTNTDPALLFGGTWVQLENRFLLGAGSSYNNGATGGSANAVVVSHNHAANANSFVQSNVDFSVNSNGRAVTSQGGSNWHYVYVSNEEYKSNQSVSNSSTTANRGESGTGKNMPPYLVVYMWKRTA